jgi:hypothetical protein
MLLGDATTEEKHDAFCPRRKAPLPSWPQKENSSRWHLAPDSALLGEPEVLVLLPCLGLGVAAGVYLRRRVRPSADSL